LPFINVFIIFKKILPLLNYINVYYSLILINIIYKGNFLGHLTGLFFYEKILKPKAKNNWIIMALDEKMFKEGKIHERRSYRINKEKQCL